MQHFVIQNTTLCDHRGQRQGDVLIKNGVIEKIGESLQAPHYIDGNALHLLPSCIDLNARPKSFKSKDLQRFIQKAQNGGISVLALYPTQDPYQYDFLKSISSDFILAIQPFIDHKIQNVSILHKAGGRFLSFPSNLSNNTLKIIYDYAKMLEIPCVCYCDDEEFSQFSSMQSPLNSQLGLSSCPPYLQSLEFAKIIQIAQHFKIPTLFQSVNESNVLKAKTLYTFHEVSIHHLIANETQIQPFNTLAKIHPPLCTQAEQHALLENFSHIDMLTSLHQECSMHQKEQTFDEAQSGIECLECYFPLLYTTLVHSNIISLPHLSKITAYHQSRFLRLPQGEIKEGLKSELILVDLESKTKATYALSQEKELYGKIVAYISSQNGYLEV